MISCPRVRLRCLRARMVFGDPEYPEETAIPPLPFAPRTEQRNMTLRSDGVIDPQTHVDKGFREYQTPIITASSPRRGAGFRRVCIG